MPKLLELRKVIKIVKPYQNPLIPPIRCTKLLK